MIAFIKLFEFLSIVLRCATLVFQSLAIGGLAFWWVWGRYLRFEDGAVRRSSRRLLFRSALALALIQLALVASNLLILVNTTGVPLRAALGANFAVTGSAVICGGVAFALYVLFAKTPRSALLACLAVVIICGDVMSSQAASLIEHRTSLLLLTGIHQAAVACWIGVIPYLLLELRQKQFQTDSRLILKRYIFWSLGCASVLAASGFAMGYFTIHTWSAAIGTAYGVLVIAKFSLLVTMVLLLVVARRLREREVSLFSHPLKSQRLCAMGQVQLAMGVCAILAASSLGAQPPATDVIEGRVTRQEIVRRFTPHWPRLRSPNVKSLSPSTLQLQKRLLTATGLIPLICVPSHAGVSRSTPADIAWSEYNHNWAGLVLLFVGLLALLARTGYLPWSNNWPLLFLGLAIFIFLRADPENWPLGPNGFWESCAEPEVLQHRLAALLIVFFAFFEWAVITKRIQSLTAASIFPIVCISGGAILLTHSHALGSIQEELLAEMSHVPLALLGILAGCSRWIELRAPEGDPLRRYASWVWPICFLLVGAVLLNYREA